MLNTDRPLWDSCWKAPGQRAHLCGHLVAVILILKVQDGDLTKTFRIKGLTGLRHVDSKSLLLTCHTSLVQDRHDIPLPLSNSGKWSSKSMRTRNRYEKNQPSFYPSMLEGSCWPPRQQIEPSMSPNLMPDSVTSVHFYHAPMSR